VIFLINKNPKIGTGDEMYAYFLSRSAGCIASLVKHRICLNSRRPGASQTEFA
jgi:hypothetical protein